MQCELPPGGRDAKHQVSWMSEQWLLWSFAYQQVNKSSQKILSNSLSWKCSFILHCIKAAQLSSCAETLKITDIKVILNNDLLNKMVQLCNRLLIWTSIEPVHQPAHRHIEKWMVNILGGSMKHCTHASPPVLSRFCWWFSGNFIDVIQILISLRIGSGESYVFTI